MTNEDYGQTAYTTVFASIIPHALINANLPVWTSKVGIYWIFENFKASNEQPHKKMGKKDPTFNPFTALPRVLFVVKFASHMNTSWFKEQLMVKGTKLNYPKLF